MSPIVWAILGERVGDNRQVDALAQRLGWPYLVKQLAYNRLFALPNRVLGPSLTSVHPEYRTSLTPPWPDLIIAAGRRSVAPARWIKKQSGGKTKLVQIGRPRADLKLFDLVVTTAQYGLPARPNLARLTFPLTGPPIAQNSATDTMTAEWAQKFRQLPRPWTGLLVGGATWPYPFSPTDAQRLANEINQWVRKFGGSLLVSTGPRTPADFATALDREIEAEHHFHQWSPQGENPHKAILTLADNFIVTGDSISLAAEACGTGAPVAIWRPPSKSNAMTRAAFAFSRSVDKPGMVGHGLRGLANRGLFSPPRLVSRVHDAAIADGRACWFDSTCEISCSSSGDDGEALANIVDRVRNLVIHLVTH